MGNVFQTGEFKLNSGKISELKIDCDFFQPEDIKSFAFLITKLVPPFKKVVGVPSGGLDLAVELERYQTEIGKILIVDDVLTTGNSIQRLRHQLAENWNLRYDDFIGAVMYSRGFCPEWITEIFQINSKLFGI